MQRDVAACLAGGIAGAIGTVFMSAVMIAGRKAGMTGTLPPEKLSEKALHIVGIDHHKEATQDVLAAVLHVGFGATMGAVFGSLQRRIAAPLSAPIQGVVFATAVWAVSYKGWIPAFGVMPPPERDRPGRPVVMVIAHWVYGWTMGRTLDTAYSVVTAGVPGGTVH